MFADIMGASEVSNHKTPREYAQFVKEFQSLFRTICRLFSERFYEGKSDDFSYTARGDEGLLMIHPRGTGRTVSDHVDTAIHIALQLKRQWLCSKENERRINSGLLPIDLGIGIHAGRTYLSVGKPEGYAINLAKRVEGYSRQFGFSHILISEAAQGYLQSLPDETTYFLSPPRTITPKGISRDVRVFEVAHHFLPTDWKESQRSSVKSRTLLSCSPREVELLARALALNPTNRWLIEEFIRSQMLYAYRKLARAHRSNEDRLKRAFVPSMDAISLLSQTELRDPGVLLISGFLDGEVGDYDEEQKKYQTAIDIAELPEAFWYKAVSLSYEVFDSGGSRRRAYDKLPDQLREKVEESITCYKEAKIRRPGSAWIPFDYGCELLKWQRNEDEIGEGITNLASAFSKLDQIGSGELIRDAIRKEPYLRRWRNHPRVSAILG